MCVIKMLCFQYFAMLRLKICSVFLHCLFGDCSIREFGASVINIEPILKSLSGLFEHSDKNVRAEVCMWDFWHMIVMLVMYLVTSNM